MSITPIMIIVRRFRLVVWASACCTAGTLLAMDLNPHTDPDNTGHWVLNEDISDEFNGDSIDLEKWFIQGADGHFENNFLGRAPSQFAPENISIENGYLKITSRWQPDYEFSDKLNRGRQYEKITTGAVISKAKFLHGYMEIRCRAADGPISSGFWTTGKGGELDVFEHWGENKTKPDSAKKYRTSLFDWRDPKSPTWGKRIWTNDHLLEFRTADDFQTYALEWDPDYIKIYVNGRLLRYVSREEVGDGWVITNEQKVWLDSKFFPWEVDLDTLSAKDYPGNGREFIVDYVRIWQRLDPERGPVPVAPTNLISNSGFESGAEGWVLKGDAKLTTGDHASSGNSAIHLDGSGRLERIVTVKPGTTYVASAWAKVLDASRSDDWKEAFIGVKKYGGERIRRKYVRSTYYRMSFEFTTGPDATEAILFFTNGSRGDEAVVDDFELYVSHPSDE